MKEYGGFIEFEHFFGTEYHSTAKALNSGRHALEYLIRAKGIRKLFLPYFLCDSVPHLCEKLGTDIERYHTDEKFHPIFDGKLNGGEYLYLVNFYGQLSDAFMLSVCENHKNVIIDNAQDFFRLPLQKIDTCYTCRKFFGVSDGGYLYTDAEIGEELPTDESFDRMEFLLGRAERGANEFYSAYVNNNKKFASEPLKKMSVTTQNLMRAIDCERIKRVRTENFAHMHDALGAKNRLQPEIPDGAFMYPFYIENGADMRKKLQEKNIYIPTLWPSVFEVTEKGSLEYDMAENILPLPVDQRYGRDDIDEIINTVKSII